MCTLILFTNVITYTINSPIEHNHQDLHQHFYLMYANTIWSRVSYFYLFFNESIGVLAITYHKVNLSYFVCSCFQLENSCLPDVSTWEFYKCCSEYKLLKVFICWIKFVFLLREVKGMIKICLSFVIKVPL